MRPLSLNHNSHRREGRKMIVDGVRISTMFEEGHGFDVVVKTLQRANPMIGEESIRRSLVSYIETRLQRYLNRIP